MYLADGTYLRSVLTNSGGFYLFDYVVPGNYQIRFDIPPSYTPTFRNVGNVNNDSNIDQQGLTGIFTLDNETHLTDIDAGFYQCASIGELIWYDSNKNDIEDDIENGINGLQVLLWRNHFGSWIVWDDVTSGHKPGTPSDDGYWKFCAPPGQYYVQVVMPPLGLVRARPNVGNNPNKDSDLNNANGVLTTSSFYISSGQTKLDLAGGFYPMAVSYTHLDVYKRQVQCSQCNFRRHQWKSNK